MSDPTIDFDVFHFQNRATDDPRPPDWFVTLIRRSADPFTGATVEQVSQPMTPEQAEAAGFALPAIIAGINGSALAEVTALTAARDALDEALETAQASIQSLTDQVAALTPPADPAPEDDQAEPPAS